MVATNFVFLCYLFNKAYIYVCKMYIYQHVSYSCSQTAVPNGLNFFFEETNGYPEGNIG